LDKTVTDDGRLAMTVRVDPAKVAQVRAKFEAPDGADRTRGHQPIGG
jgi:hypothetical protein